MAGISISSLRQWAGLLLTSVALGVLSACTLWNRADEGSPPPPAAAPPPAPPAAASPVAPPAASPAMPAAPADPQVSESIAAPVPPSGPGPPVAPKPASGKAVKAPSLSRGAGKPATVAHSNAAAAPGGAPAAAAAKPMQPALDLAALEQRLKDTKAIGVFTKLSLKNQVDDLLDEFKKYHHSTGVSSPPASLRSQYDLLMIKVLSLLQDGDPQLAASISSSREALWDILKDPNKFAKI